MESTRVNTTPASAIDRIRFPIVFDAARLRADLELLERSPWTDHYVRQNYEGTWSVLPLRAPRGETHVVRMIYADPSCRDFVDTPFLEMCEYIPDVLGWFRAPIEAVRLMKLAPGSVIKEHTDHDLALEYGAIRVHVPIATNPGVEFHVNSRAVPMREGECWYLRLSDPHRVANHGDTDRVHLVIDLRADDWLRAMLTDTTG